MTTRRAIAAAVLVATLGAACSTPATEPQSARQSEVAEKGRSVMPFDLEKTTHRFTPRPDGLLQEVVADVPGDMAQIGPIRTHLTEESTRFRSGDFTDPASIHGGTMPGLTELTAGAPRITIDYAELPDGASLSFHTNDPALITALHAWGEAQVSDHGEHAEHGNR
ncbi:hypothetical protein NQK81_28255 [Amycolatopsis roodepoortensis]|uniref:hypothetical protein n=1 Tax=Amycolatopsis roodepoortensis TaxID=700274 RepID=UPI00214ABD09|nr:hypothetical protein [Amycolatopsis roodepoortensis]UUV28664.1 hypothetical protein NQK81_28255 [Amycolatopsis roodepoortensis]